MQTSLVVEMQVGGPTPAPTFWDRQRSLAVAELFQSSMIIYIVFANSFSNDLCLSIRPTFWLGFI